MPYVTSLDDGTIVGGQIQRQNGRGFLRVHVLGKAKQGNIEC